MKDRIKDSKSYRSIALVTLILIAGASIGYLTGRARASGIPTTQALTYAGVLSDASGTPLTGSKNVQVLLFDAATGGNQLCATTPSSMMLQAGAFQISLPDACTAAVQASTNVWVDVFVDGASVGRTKLAAVPYAVEAAEASCGPGVTGMVDTGAGFCIDAADRGPELAYGDSLSTCAKEGKVVCSLAQLCTARIRSVGALSGTVGYRVADLMYYASGAASYLGGGGGGNPLSLPAVCAPLLTPGPHAGVLAFRCCRGKG